MLEGALPRCVQPRKAAPPPAPRSVGSRWHWVGGTDLFPCHSGNASFPFRSRPPSVRAPGLHHPLGWEVLRLMALAQRDQGGMGRDITRTVLHPSCPCSQDISRPPSGLWDQTRRRMGSGCGREQAGNGEAPEMPLAAPWGLCRQSKCRPSAQLVPEPETQGRLLNKRDRSPFASGKVIKRVPFEILPSLCSISSPEVLSDFRQKMML